MKIAILGATSEMAKDLILSFFEENIHELTLFARRPDAVEEWLNSVGIKKYCQVKRFELFRSKEKFDAIVNFIGVGNPGQAIEIGSSIFDVTLEFDNLVLAYLRDHMDCRYIFLSSGVVYFSNFNLPVFVEEKAMVPVNNIQPQDWYAAAKLHAECRHRSLKNLSIVDIRVFNYFSYSQDLLNRYFISDMIRAIKNDEIFLTSTQNIARDYIGPLEFFQIIRAVLHYSPMNDVIDCYTLAPIEKIQLLNIMALKFGLQYKFQEDFESINATGVKKNYYSLNHRAALYGYKPTRDSEAILIGEANKIFDKQQFYY